MANSDITVEKLDIVLKNDPNNAEAWRLKGDLLVRKTLFYAAMRCYIKSSIIDPDYPDAWKGRGLVSLYQTNNVDALQFFNKSLLYKRKDSDVFRLKAHSYVWNEVNEKKILENLDTAITLNPNDIRPLISKGLFLKKQRCWDESQEIFEKGLSINPANIICILNKNWFSSKKTKSHTISFLKEQYAFTDEVYQIKMIADTLLLSFDFQNANSCFEYLLEIQPNSADTIKKKGLITLMNGNLKESLEFFSRYLKMEPDDSDVWTRRGEILRRQNRIVEAIDSFDTAISKDPDNEEAWRRKGFAQSMRHENFAGAIGCLNKSLELDPHHVMTMVQKSNFLSRKPSTWNEALLWLDNAIDEDPTFILAWKRKAEMYITNNDYESALLCYDNILKLDPEDVISWYNAGVVQAKFAETQYQKGINYFKQSKFEEAIEFFQKTLSVDSNDVQTMKLYAESLINLNKKKEALSLLKKALTADPTDKQLDKAVIDLQSQLQ